MRYRANMLVSARLWRDARANGRIRGYRNQGPRVGGCMLRGWLGSVGRPRIALKPFGMSVAWSSSAWLQTGRSAKRPPHSARPSHGFLVWISQTTGCCRIGAEFQSRGVMLGGLRINQISAASRATAFPGLGVNHPLFPNSYTIGTETGAIDGGPWRALRSLWFHTSAATGGPCRLDLWLVASHRVVFPARQ